MKYIYIIFFIALIPCNNPQKQYRLNVDLQGQWQFALDTANVGEEQKWYLSDLDDIIQLPGTTDLNKKGFANTDTTTMHLNRFYKYKGIVWYRKAIKIPESFTDKHIQLVFERTRNSKVWIDSIFIGDSHLLQSPQKLDISDYLSPGTHYITVQINNDLKLTPYGNVHIYSDDTQTNWNGIIGKIYLEASDNTYISNLQAYPNIKKLTVDVVLEIDNKLNLSDFNVELEVEKTVYGKTTKLN